MKTIFWTLLALTFFVKAQGQQLPQSYDSLVQRILKLETSTAQLQVGLQKSHREFRTGTALMIVGTLITGLSFALTEKQTNNINTGLAAVGGTLMVVGGIIQIDSHKHIGRAGNFKKKEKDLNWHQKQLNSNP